MSLLDTRTECADVEHLRQQLHDRVVQIVDFMACAGHGMLTRCDQYQTLASDAAAELRIVMGDVSDGGMTIRSAVHDLVEQAQRRTSLDISVSVTDQVSMRASAPYRDVIAALGECLNNAIRHSDATSIDVIVDATSDGGVRVRIGDDGCGFDATARLGRGMQARLLSPAASGDMTLAIDSSPIIGTTITVSKSR